ncbi:hypothetical protein P4197_25330 [Pseudomonas aeruginosa]|nr:hypothetical protein [Pseudomonas aeruginosa]
MRYIKATLRERLLDTLRGEVCGAPSHFAVASVTIEEGQDKFKALGRIMANIRDAIYKISPTGDLPMSIVSLGFIALCEKISF